MSQSVKDIGERGLLTKLQLFCPEDIVGDDGAILPTEPDKSLVVTTDVLVEGVHFSDRTTSPYDVGWRSTTANLSDLAAMGATPLGITIGLSLPGTLAVSWIEELYRGIQDCLSRYQTYIVGGDICRSQTIGIAITAFGQVAPHRSVLRRNAKPGDAIVVTGLHGLSRAGLELLTNPDAGNCLSDVEIKKAIAAHQRPLPRLDILPFLEQLPPEISVGGMDSSDGLADAISQICRCSQVGAEINYSSLEFPQLLVKLAGAKTAWDWMLYGGEDFELVLSLPPTIARDLLEYLGGEAAIIGKFTDEPLSILVNKDSSQFSISDFTQGFQHF